MGKKTNNKVVAYLRSACGAEGLEEQREALHEYAKKNNFIVDEYWEDKGVPGSGKHHKPALDQLLKRLKAGDVLIVNNYSRLGRNAKDLAAILSELEGRQVKIIAVDLCNDKAEA